jgi:hypothetical protein
MRGRPFEGYFLFLTYCDSGIRIDMQHLDML